MLLLLLLICFTYLSQVPHVPVSCIIVPELMQDLQINSLVTQIFHKGVMVIQKDIKLFHKFIDSCGLIHVHIQERNNIPIITIISFLFIYLQYWGLNSESLQQT
jgi:hypothetical protein